MSIGDQPGGSDSGQMAISVTPREDDAVVVTVNGEVDLLTKRPMPLAFIQDVSVANSPVPPSSPIASICDRSSRRRRSIFGAPRST